MHLLEIKFETLNYEYNACRIEPSQNQFWHVTNQIGPKIIKYSKGWLG